MKTDELGKTAINLLSSNNNKKGFPRTSKWFYPQKYSLFLVFYKAYT